MLGGVVPLPIARPAGAPQAEAGAGPPGGRARGRRGGEGTPRGALLRPASPRLPPGSQPPARPRAVPVGVTSGRLWMEPRGQGHPAGTPRCPPCLSPGVAAGGAPSAAGIVAPERNMALVRRRHGSGGDARVTARSWGASSPRHHPAAEPKPSSFCSPRRFSGPNWCCHRAVGSVRCGRGDEGPGSVSPCALRLPCGDTGSGSGHDA